MHLDHAENYSFQNAVHNYAQSACPPVLHLTFLFLHADPKYPLTKR